MPINIRQSPAHAATKVHEQKDDEHRANTFVAFHSMDQPVVRSSCNLCIQIFHDRLENSLLVLYLRAYASMNLLSSNLLYCTVATARIAISTVT